MRVSQYAEMYVLVRVTPKTELHTVADPTNDLVSMAFLIEGSVPTASTSWTQGDWDHDVVNERFYARCLIGPGHLALVPGVYYPWVKVADAPETVIGRAANTLTVV